MMKMTHAWALLAAALLVVPLAGFVDDATYKAEIEKWRQDREARLKADDGWLTVAGLHFLNEGENRFGTDPLNDIVLPPGSAPAVVGTFEYHGAGKTTVRAAAGTKIVVNGEPAESADLTPNGGPGRPDRITIGNLTLIVHYSGDRYGIRLWDKNSSIRTSFTGCRWFPVNERYRVTASFHPYASPKQVDIPNILGDVEKFTVPGSLTFSLDGQEYRLEPFSSGRGLFIIFRDLTSGQETYPAVRFLNTDAPENGQVVLDFNKATNPPCAFNPYTTCPLPPPQNRLRTRIEAGELNYHRPEATSATRRE